MNNLKEMQKQEAVRRMKTIKLSSAVIKEFEKENVVYYSERQSRIFDGILYWISNEDKFVKIVSDFEKEFDALVYHAQLSPTEFGDLLALLYVSSHQSEWESDLNDLMIGEAIAYVVNVDYNEGELGSIGVEPRNGGISRTW